MSFISEFSLRPKSLSEAEDIIRKKIISYNQIDQKNFNKCCKEFKNVFFLDRSEKASVLIKNFINIKFNSIKKVKLYRTYLINLKLEIYLNRGNRINNEATSLRHKFQNSSLH